MNKFLVKLLLLVILIVGIHGCKEEGPFMSLKIGNEWKYFHTFHDESDTVVSRISEVKGDVYLMENGPAYLDYWSLKHDGLYAGWNYASINFVPFPLEKGRKWNVRDIKTEIIGREKIKTKAGRFNCWRIHYQQGIHTYTYWFAPGIGLVKAIEDTHEWELLSYSLIKD